MIHGNNMTIDKRNEHISRKIIVDFKLRERFLETHLNLII